MATASSSTLVLTAPQAQPTLHLTSTKTEVQRETIAIQFRDSHTGIGIKVIGGRAEGGTHGIFIKRLISGGKAATDGRLREGDELVRVNGETIAGCSYSEGLQLLRESAASGQVTLVVARDTQAKEEFSLLMEEELTTASESSRMTTPINTFDSSHSSDTMQSENSQSGYYNDGNNQSQAVMNNNQSRLTRTQSQNSGNRQEIQRLANIFSHRLQGSEAMASTPYSATKGSNQAKLAHLRHEASLQPDTPGIQQLLGRGTESNPPVGSWAGDTGYAASGETLFAQQVLSSIRGESDANPAIRVVPPTPQPIQPDTRCSFERLETALSFLGLSISEQQKRQLRSMLSVDSSGLVSYAQFIHLAKQMFHDDLKRCDISQATHLIPTISQSTHTLPTTTAHRVTLPSAAKAPLSSDLSAEIKRLEEENMELRRQIHAQSRRLRDQTQLTKAAERDLHKLRTETQAALEQTTSLQEKLDLATDCQRLANQQEIEYERVIEGLEHELQILRDNEAKQLESPTVRKKLTLMGAQLRKSEERRKTYHVATQRLLDYCQQVYDTFTTSSGSAPRHTPQQIATEALDTMNLVRNLLERDPLPFGWEECYNEEGSRYFINHITEETSWHHPISRRDATVSKRIA
ncbi:syntaxin-binding protein 4-like isoform X2 [Watersipora subatra]|uniref:syntaxin-binding protein 4-like isoform X2 n=1 Tax=Watersipora subatra TaxID=2589382 RepID=UPI00355C4C00